MKTKPAPAKRVELLAPAGNMECFYAALRYGADAVYLAGKNFGLRAAAQNFTQAQLAHAVSQAHARGKKIYVTVNALLRSEEMAEIGGYLHALKDMRADAVILSDPGMIGLVKDAGLEFHISTQLSTMNDKCACFWHTAGAKRVILARELSLREIAEIYRNTPETLELEAFVHGAMCVAYSGRCILSSVFTGRSGNRGECAQPCRWQYTLHEAGYPYDFLPIFEDARGTYVLNSRDLMMIEHIPALIRAGLSSFKIEGRMKSAYYVASVVHAYRRAIDAYYAGPEEYVLDERWVEELKDCTTRGFCTGFYFGEPEKASDIYRLPQERAYNFCGIVRGDRDENGMYLIEQRNKFSVGDRIMILSPAQDQRAFTMEKIIDLEGNTRQSAPHPQEMLKIACPCTLEPGDMLKVRQHDASLDNIGL